MSNLIMNQGLYLSGLLAIYFWFALPTTKQQPQVQRYSPATRDVYEIEIPQLGGGRCR